MILAKEVVIFKKIFVISVLMIRTGIICAQEGWYVQNSGTSKSLFDVHFIDAQTGWIASMTNTILYTSDGGNNWVDLNPPPSVNYWAVHFVSSQEGYAVGNNGKIRHTTDAGSTWEDQSSNVSYNLWDIYFLDENTGWIAGGRESGFNQDPIRYIIKTTNGGNIWSTQLYDYDELQLFAIHFLNADIGYAVGDAGTIFHTTDGGALWSQQSSGIPTHLRGVHAVSPDKAWVVGINGVLLKTINGGLIWESVNAGISHDFSDIYFTDEQTGWIAGGDTAHGTILHTTDGGNSWNLQNTGTSNFLFSVYFTEPDTGWAVGYDGTIIHTTTGGTGMEEIKQSTRLPKNFILAQNVPNPFSRSSTIRFAVHHAGHVELKVYDIIGQERAILVDGELNVGAHSVIFKALNLPGGIYYYRLVSNNIFQTKQCVLLK